VARTTPLFYNFLFTNLFSIKKNYFFIISSLFIKADQLSRKINHDDWGIRSNVFDLYNHKWGSYTVDRFATHYNTQCVRFNSPIWCPGTEAVDAFSQYWGRENNWLVPPPSLISRVLNKMKRDKAYGGA
jgi:hypothetical protein